MQLASACMCGATVSQAAIILSIQRFHHSKQVTFSDIELAYNIESQSNFKKNRK
jgi:hypothetical protein